MASGRVDVLIHGATSTPVTVQPPRVLAAVAIPAVTPSTVAPGDFPSTSLFPSTTQFPGP